MVILSRLEDPVNKIASPPAMALTAAAVMLAIAASLGMGDKPAHAARPEPSANAPTTRELVEDLDRASASDPDGAMRIAQQLWTRRKEIPRRDLVSMIADTNGSETSRELLVDLLAGPPEEAQVTDDVRGLLRDRRLDSRIRARIVAAYDFGPEDSALLSSLASSPDDAVAFHALEKLGSADPAAARRLALAAIAEPARHSDSRLSASYKVLIRSGTLQSDRGARTALLRHLASVLRDHEQRPELQDSATFALVDLRALDALRTLLETPGTDRILRVGAVDQNAALIKSAVEHDPDEATVELAVTAMELYPVSEIADPLRAARGTVRSPALRKRIDEVLASIATHGMPLNVKWAED
jgi:hypothetical protein